MPNEQFLYRTEEILDKMCQSLGGRAAEEVVFGSITTGAHDDLRKVTQMAYSQVKVYGMSEGIGPLSFASGGYLNPYSNSTGELMDSEVRQLVDKAYKRTVELMKEKRDQLESLAQQLLSSEVVRTEELETLLGQRPWDTPAVEMPQGCDL